MTPKEKAKELFDRYYAITGPFTEAKQCALIAVDEILEANPMYPIQSRPMKRSNGTDMVLTEYPPFLYWQEVKNEIEKI